MQARVLIVDDNPLIRAALRHLLQEHHQWEISEAEDGEAGIARALEVRPHVVVLDLVMPVLDGLNAAQKISQVLPETAIVMYTMHSSRLLEIEAQKRGVRKLISKAQSSLLLSTVRELIAALPSQPAAATSDPAQPVILPSDSTVPADAVTATTSETPPSTPDPKLAS